MEIMFRDKYRHKKVNYKLKHLSRILVVVISLCTVIFIKSQVYGDNVKQDSGNGVNNDNNNYNINPASFILDNVNIYDEMNESYAAGYMPKVTNNTAIIVLPLLSGGEIKDNIVNASVSLGDVNESPFVWKNYNKSVSLTENIVNGGGKINAYAVRFDLELKSDRYNGIYPVSITIKGKDSQGTEIVGEYVIYVTIIDGREKEDDTQKQTNMISPKVLVENYTFSKENIMAGDEVQVDIVLKNHSDISEVKNLTVSIQENGEFFSLADKSAGTYVGEIMPGNTASLSYKYKVGADTPPAQYNFVLNYEYADASGNVCTGSENLKMTVGQPANIHFDKVDLGKSVKVADKIMINVHAMNMGRVKVHNVRAVIEMDGLSLGETIFIGDMEAGSEASDSVMADVKGLSGANPYGNTTGTITFIYEDNNGNSFEVPQDIELNISSPFEDIKTDEPDKPQQWWKIMLGIGSAIVIIIMYLIGRKLYFKKILNEVIYDDSDSKDGK